MGKNKRKKSAVVFWRIIKTEDILAAKKLFKKVIKDNDLFCKKCKRLIFKRKCLIKKKVILPPSSSSSSSSPSSSLSSTSSSFRVIEPPNRITDYTDIDIPCCTASQRYCIVCGTEKERARIPNLVRYQTYLRYNFYIPKEVRCCKTHYLNNIIYEDCFSRIKPVANSSLVPIEDLKWILEESLSRSTKSPLLQSFSEKSISDQNCKSISGLCKEHFYDLLTKLTSLKNSKNRTVAAALVIFLVKMKTNMSHDNISAFFSMKNASLVGHICDEVEVAFIKDILPYHIGVQNLTREFLMSRQTEIAKALNPEAELILIADGTYAYHQKSKNNLYQRKSYSVQKNANLCKPFTVVTTDGYIIDFFGPYIATANDAKIFKSLLSKNQEFRDILKPNDCFIVDRGFRDCVDFVNSLGYCIKMPCTRKADMLTTNEANASRIVTKVRWVVESIHGII